MTEKWLIAPGEERVIDIAHAARLKVSLVGGQVDVIVQNPSDIVPQVKAGKLRLLASASPMRWTEMPDVPTMKEQGYDVEIDSWLGIAFPKGVDKSIRDKLEKVAITALKSPTTANVFAAGGMDPTALTGEQYRKMLVKDYDVMGKAIKAANIPTNH